MKRMITIAAALMLLAAAGACEKYEDGRPSKDVRTEFARMYPDAWDVEWEPQGRLMEMMWNIVRPRP